MATRKLSAEELEAVTRLAKQWGKIVVKQAFGEQGPGLDVDFAQMEEVAGAAARGLTEGALEVAAAHHRGLPARQGAGPIGVLRTEMVKQRRLLPIRQLVKRAGAAMQAIKPVFMMSPLSVAQFLEPGVIGFDVLVANLIAPPPPDAKDDSK